MIYFRVFALRWISILDLAVSIPRKLADRDCESNGIAADIEYRMQIGLRDEVVDFPYDMINWSRLIGNEYNGGIHKYFYTNSIHS